jgi:hypothetical protein
MSIDIIDWIDICSADCIDGNYSFLDMCQKIAEHPKLEIIRSSNFKTTFKIEGIYQTEFSISNKLQNETTF